MTKVVTFSRTTDVRAYRKYMNTWEALMTHQKCGSPQEIQGQKWHRLTKMIPVKRMRTLQRFASQFNSYTTQTINQRNLYCILNVIRFYSSWTQKGALIDATESITLHLSQTTSLLDRKNTNAAWPSQTKLRFQLFSGKYMWMRSLKPMDQAC